MKRLISIEAARDLGYDIHNRTKFRDLIQWAVNYPKLNFSSGWVCNRLIDGFNWDTGPARLDEDPDTGRRIWSVLHAMLANERDPEIKNIFLVQLKDKLLEYFTVDSVDWDKVFEEKYSEDLV